jgi:4a-hydroxytetrahydrobiopterin dehydratase
MERRDGQVVPLTEKTCTLCASGTEALTAIQVETLLGKLGGGWQMAYGHHLSRTYNFRDFRSALDFANLVGELAEKVSHHPDLIVGWGKVEITLYTHAAGGVTQNDFVLASMISGLAQTQLSASKNPADRPVTV